MELIRSAEGSIRIEARLGSMEEHKDFNHRMVIFMESICGKNIRVSFNDSYSTVGRIGFGVITFKEPPEQAVRVILEEVKRLYPTKYHKVRVGVSTVINWYWPEKGT